jgi:hypothetical protein
LERLRDGVVGSVFAALARVARGLLAAFAGVFAVDAAAAGFVGFAVLAALAGFAALVVLVARFAGADPFASFADVRFAGVLVAVRFTGFLVAGLAFVAATYCLSLCRPRRGEGQTPWSAALRYVECRRVTSLESSPLTSLRGRRRPL